MSVITIDGKKTVSLSQATHKKWDEFTWLRRGLPDGDFAVGNPVVVIYSHELPSDKKGYLVMTKDKFDGLLKKLD